MKRGISIREHGRTGGALTSVTLVLALAACAWFLWLLESDVAAADFKRVETKSSRVDVGVAWCDPRWSETIRALVAAHPAFDSDDPDSAARLSRSLAALPFVAAVSEPEPVWPDGLRVPLRLREPIACVRFGREFLVLAEDGVVLPGAWPSPPRRGGGTLPLLALDEATERAIRPGQVIWSDAIADSLSVASSLWAELDAADLARLGRSMIDARRARLADAREPGTVIHLEDGRRILFGRAPSTTEPGELPASMKWVHVANALYCLPSGPPATEGGPPTAREGETDWELVEVRWDHPEMLARGAAGARVPVKGPKSPKPAPSAGAGTTPKRAASGAGSGARPGPAKGGTAPAGSGGQGPRVQ